MEFITAEQFLEQSKEVQKVFWEQWKPSIGDLVSIKDMFGIPHISCILSEDEETLVRNSYKEQRCIPLLTAGPLIQFIEDKTGLKINISPSLEGKYYIGYDKYANNEDGDLCRLVYVDKILDGLWLVALKVAKESVRSEN